MKLVKWGKLPGYMQTDEVRSYYNCLQKRHGYLLMKRLFDVYFSLVLLILLSPVFAILALLIYIDDRGPIFFRQERITQFGKIFKIYKFRTMVCNAEKLGTQVTVKGDNRITRIGSILRKYRLDEIPQLINVLLGEMSFVGTRPEVEKYVKAYKPEMYATLLLPAGVTSETSIAFKDEDEIFARYSDKMETDEIYIEKILPEKMKLNLVYQKQATLYSDFMTMLKTVGL